MSIQIDDNRRSVILIAGLADGRMAAELFLRHPRIDLLRLCSRR
jgi:hypothetical protein